MKTIQLNAKIIVLTGLIMLANNLFSQDPNFYIYLCFGQSNMEGQGTIEAQDKIVDTRFKVMEATTCSNIGRTKGTWYTAKPPLCRCYTGLSPADYFGKTMVANLPDSINVGVVNVSVAGCKIELFDKDNYQDYVSTITEDWLLNIINAYNGNPYAYLVEIAKLAQNDGVIKGILLHQGESNVGDIQWTSKVKKIYTDLISDLELISDSVPLLAGEVVNTDQGGICSDANALIAALPDTIPNSYVISSIGCTDAADNLHFNSNGYRELGWRYALTMLSTMGYDTTDLTDVRVPAEPVDTSENVSGLDEPLNGSDNYNLGQNYPNPFNSNATISFTIPQNSYVSLKVFSVFGDEVAELAGNEFTSGKHTVEFDSQNLSEGIYFYTIKTDKYTASRKMIFHVNN